MRGFILVTILATAKSAEAEITMEAAFQGNWILFVVFVFCACFFIRLFLFVCRSDCLWSIYKNWKLILSAITESLKYYFYSVRDRIEEKCLCVNERRRLKQVLFTYNRWLVVFINLLHCELWTLHTNTHLTHTHFMIRCFYVFTVRTN